MNNFTKLIEIVDLSKTDITVFKRKYVGCIILSKDLKILLQMRDTESGRSFPGCLSTFGGGIEAGEEPMHALIRELHEELGATVNELEVFSFGSITEKVTNYTELLYLYFWHDRLGSIRGCYEGSPLYFDDMESIITHPKVMDCVPWLLEQCKAHGLL